MEIFIKETLNKGLSQVGVSIFLRMGQSTMENLNRDYSMEKD